MVYGCSKDESITDLKIINIPQSDDNMTIEEVASEITSIKLETNDSSFLGTISDVKIYNNYLFILDDIQKLSVFDLEGEFQTKLARIGDGPGEIDVIYSLCIDEVTGNIYISSGYRLLVFSSSLQFVKEVKYPNPLVYLFFDQNNLFAVSDDFARPLVKKFQTETFILKFNNDLEIIDSLSFRKVHLESRTIAGYRFKNWISKDNTGLYFYKPVLTSEMVSRDTLYEKIGDHFFPKIKLNFNHNIFIDKNGSKSLKIYNIIKSNNILIIEFEDEDRRVAYINLNTGLSRNIKGGFSFSNNENIVIRSIDLENDLFYFIQYDEYNESQVQESNPTINIIKLK
jgi:hypothetical protein